MCVILCENFLSHLWLLVQHYLTEHSTVLLSYRAVFSMYVTEAQKCTLLYLSLSTCYRGTKVQFAVSVTICMLQRHKNAPYSICHCLHVTEAQKCTLLYLSLSTCYRGTKMHLILSVTVCVLQRHKMHLTLSVTVYMGH